VPLFDDAVAVDATPSGALVYSASVLFTPPAASGNYIFAITGAAGVVARILKVFIALGTSGTGNTGRSCSLQILDAALTSGTATTITAAKHLTHWIGTGVATPAASSVVKAYTVAPSFAGNAYSIRSDRFWQSNTGTAPMHTTLWDLADAPEGPPELRGTSEVIAVKLNTNLTATPSALVTVEFMEE